MPSTDGSEERKKEEKEELEEFRRAEREAAARMREEDERRKQQEAQEDAKNSTFRKRMLNNFAEKNQGLGTAAATAMNPALGAIVGKYAADRQASKEQKKIAKQQEEDSRRSAKASEKATSKLDDLKRGGAGATDFNSGWLTFIIFLALIAHIYDTWTNYQRPPGDIVITSLYALIIIISFFFVSHMKITGEEGSLLGVIAVCYFLPVLIHYIQNQAPPNWILTITGLVIFFPPLVLYLFLQYPEHSFGAKTIKIYFVIWAIIAVLYLVTSPAAQQATSGGKAMIQYPIEGIKFVGQGIANLGTKVVTLTTSAMDKAVAQATGQQYEGDQENQRGIFLENFHPVEQTYYTTSDIWIEGKIRAQNIKETLPISTACSIPDKNLKGEVNPKNFNMVNNDENILDCHLGSLAPGTYQVRVSATFDYQTDAEIKYYFVDNKVNPQTYSKAQIPEKTIAIYTGGPVQVGLSSLHQPLRISADPKNESNILGVYPFGVSLTNTWTSGKISQGKQFTLEVPNAVELINCTRNPSSDSPIRSADRNKYIFNANQANIRLTFDSVTCRMKIVKPSDLLGANLEYPPERTFNANVTYEYTVEALTYVTVEKDYLANP